MQFENNIIHRPDTSDLYNDEQSLGHLLIKNLTNAGDKTVIVDGLTGRKLSAIGLVNKSIEIAKALTAAGIQQGDVVSIISENRFEFVYVLFGTIFLNCPLAPLNHTHNDREIKHAFSLSKPKFIFTGASTTKSVVKIVNDLTYVKKVILLDECHIPLNELTVSFIDFTHYKSIRNVVFEPRPVTTASSNCLIMCSSGTTGLPKGVQISQKGIIVTVRHAKNVHFIPSNMGDEEVVILGLLPLFHVGGATALINAMANVAGKVILLREFEEKAFLGCIEKYRCSVAFLVPPLMVFLAKNDLVDKYNLSCLRFISCGAAPLSKEVEQLVRDRLKISNLVIQQGYGMTELTCGVLCQKNISKPGSVGDVNDGVYAKVAAENRKALGPNQIGELCFKGSLLMMGYIGDEQATNATIDEDGWLHTGDVGYYDDDFQFFIVDRIKELIKWKSFQVPPAEIEALLLTHPKIKDCGVIGKQDDWAGELPLAFVVKGDPNLTENEVIKYVDEMSSPAKRLHGGVIFVDEIPKNPSGKILRREMRESLKQYDLKSNSLNRI